MSKGSSNWLKVLSIPGASHVAHSKESAWNVRESDLILELERFPNHSSVLAWRIPWTEEPGGLQSARGLQRVRHDRTTNSFTFLQVLSLKIVLEDNYISCFCVPRHCHLQVLWRRHLLSFILDNVFRDICFNKKSWSDSSKEEKGGGCSMWIEKHVYSNIWMEWSVYITISPICFDVSFKASVVLLSFSLDDLFIDVNKKHHKE